MYMRVAILIFLLGFILNTVSAQNCDIAQSGVVIYNDANTAPVGSVLPGERAGFKFSISNAGAMTGCQIPANSVTAVFDFPTLAGGIRPYQYDGPASFVSGYFKWTYDNSENVLVGTNTTAIPVGMGDMDVTVKVKGIVAGAGSSNLNLSQGFGISDNIGNDIGGAQLVVVSNPVPVKLASFSVSADKCSAILNWATLSELNFSRFDIEYSPDNITFFRVGSVDAKNLATGSAYKFAYSQLNGMGYYRLKLVDKDGHFDYSYVQHTRTNCAELAKVLVYPNPVQYNQKLVVNISGYQGKVSGELFNAEGQRVASYNLQNNANELTVTGLSAGVYMLYVKAEDGDVKSFKIIVTR